MPLEPLYILPMYPLTLPTSQTPNSKPPLPPSIFLSLYLPFSRMKMGSCMLLGKPKPNPRVEKATKQSKIVQIVQMDGKIIELKTPTTAGNFLVKFSGFRLSISPKPAQFLPPTYELKRGSTYYLVPIPKTEQKQSVKRVKVVITKQQLQELLAKQRSVEDVLLGLKIKSFCSLADDFSRSGYSKRKTKLEPIPEEIE